MTFYWVKEYKVNINGTNQCRAIYYGIQIGEWFVGLSGKKEIKKYQGHLPPRPLPRPGQRI